MTRESLEELRKRLLGQQSVQQMIQIRAFEIYQMRGGQPGAEAQDWFHAEGEVLAFLIAHESAREDEKQGAESADAASASGAHPAPATRKSGPRVTAKPARAKQAAQKKTAPKRATPRKSAESRSKTKQTSRRSKTEDSGQ